MAFFRSQLRTVLVGTDIRRVPSNPDPIWEAGEKGVLLAPKKQKMHKRNKKMTKKDFFCLFFTS